MNVEEIRARFQARKCETQEEFDRLLNDINTVQTTMGRPLLDRMNEIGKERAMLRIQIRAIQQQMEVLAVECHDIEQKRKDANRMFHDLKHELIQLNPREQYVKNHEPLASED